MSTILLTYSCQIHRCIFTTLYFCLSITVSVPRCCYSRSQPPRQRDHHPDHRRSSVGRARRSPLRPAVLSPSRTHRPPESNRPLTVPALACRARSTPPAPFGRRSDWKTTPRRFPRVSGHDGPRRTRILPLLGTARVRTAGAREG